MRRWDPDEGQDALFERHLKWPDGFARQIEDRLPVKTPMVFPASAANRFAGRYVVDQLLGEASGR
jgi:hypothetical protein